MSLVKIDSKGRIRKSWADKKSTKRLKVILKKLQSNRLKLTHIVWSLDKYGLNFKEIEDLRDTFLYKESQLQAIIIRRKNK